MLLAEIKIVHNKEFDNSHLFLFYLFIYLIFLFFGSVVLILLGAERRAVHGRRSITSSNEI